MSANLKQSVLLETQKERGVEIGEYYGWQMPSRYLNSSQEVRNVRENVGICDLTFGGAIRVSGTEATQFLQGLVTNDVKALEKGKGMRAAFLTGHGKVKAFCYILGMGDSFLILNDPQTHDKVFKYVFPFSYAGDFPVEDVSEQFQLLTLQGANSLLVLKESCFEPVPQLNEYEWIGTILAGQKVLVVKHSRTGEEGYDILVPKSGLKDVWDFLLLKGEFHSLSPFGLESLNILRVEAAIPEYGIDIDESNMLLETGLDDVVSFTKGCYTGQEAVAMATYRGHVSKKLSLLSFSRDVPFFSGEKVFAQDKEIGTLSSVVESETFDSKIALACIKYGFFEKGMPVEVKTEQGKYPGEVINPYLNK
jgi:folate-binding protein YgfZ